MKVFRRQSSYSFDEGVDVGVADGSGDENNEMKGCAARESAKEDFVQRRLPTVKVRLGLGKEAS